MSARKTSTYPQNVFINCPFDDEYTPIFEAIVFTIFTCGFRPLCARQRLNSAEVRLDKLVELIRQSKYSIHDLSRTTPDAVTGNLRFNMPFELGLDIGCRRFNRPTATSAHSFLPRTGMSIRSSFPTSPARTSRIINHKYGEPSQECGAFSLRIVRLLRRVQLRSSVDTRRSASIFRTFFVKPGSKRRRWSSAISHGHCFDGRRRCRESSGPYFAAFPLPPPALMKATMSSETASAEGR